MMSHERQGRAEHRAWWEMGAVLATGASHLIFESLFEAKAVFIVAVSALWTGYIVHRVRSQPGVLREWGFRRDNLPRAFRVVAAISVPAAAGLVGLSFILGHSPLTWDLIPLFLLYPLWGLVQQFLLQALVAANIQRLTRSTTATVALSAVLFGAAHAPDLPLCALTFALALLYVPIYLRHRNLYPLALFHGWLGALAYVGILGRDPWAEITAQLGLGG